MTIVSVSASATSSVTTITTAAANMSGMTMLCAYLVCFGGGVNFPATAVTDSSSNTYTKIGTDSGANSQLNGMWYCLAPTVSSSMTFTGHTNVATSGNAIAVIGWDGTSPAFDQGSNSTFGNDTGASNITTPSITTTSASELIVTGYTNDDGGDVATIASAGATSATFSVDQSINGNTGQRITLGHALVSATGTYAAKWSTNGGTPHEADGIASFSQTAGGAQDTPELRGRFGLRSESQMRQLLAQ